MSHFERVYAAGILGLIVILSMAAATLMSCSTNSQPAVQTSSSKPTVSYVYDDDQGLLDATRKAEIFCAQYDAWPSTAGTDSRSDRRHITFACDLPRTALPARSTVVVAPASPLLNYPYRDDRGLIEAVNQAQRYCMGFNASARSTPVTTNMDGSRTVSFECVPM